MIGLLVALTSWLSILVVEKTGLLVPKVLGGTITLKDGTVLTLKNAEEIERARKEHWGDIASANLDTDSTIGVRLIGAATAATFVTLIGYVLVRERRKLRQWLRVGPRELLYGALGGILLIVASTAYEAVLNVLNVPSLEMGPIEELWKLMTSSSIGIVLAVMLAPLAEELYFRGRLFDALSNSWGQRVAIWGTAALFSAAHLIPTLLPVYLLYGFTLAVLRQRTTGLAAPILAHAINNAVGVYLIAQSS